MPKRNLSTAKPKIGTYIDPLSDYGFKRIFVSEPYKELLIDFLNEILQGRKVIKDLVYNKNEHEGPISSSRKVIYDLACTGEKGEQFIIEVQRIRQQFFKDRSIYYSSRLISNQAPQGGKWNYSLREVYFIAIMDFVLKDSAPEDYLHPVSLVYEKSGKEFYDKLRHIYIEIPKFTKTEKELETGIDKWMYLLKNLSHLEKIPLFLKRGIFSKLFDIALVSHLTKEELMNYESDLKAYWDEIATRETLINEGMEKGMEKGLEKKSYKVVKNLLLFGKFSIAEIANIADVNENYVRQVEKDLKK